MTLNPLGCRNCGCNPHSCDQTFDSVTTADKINWYEIWKKKRGLIFNCQIHSYNSLETFSVGYKKDAYFFCHKAIKCIINTDCIYVKGKFVY